MLFKSAEEFEIYRQKVLNDSYGYTSLCGPDKNIKNPWPAIMKTYTVSDSRNGSYECAIWVSFSEFSEVT